MNLKEFLRRHARFAWVLGGVIVLTLIFDGLVLQRRARYQSETERLRAGMSDFERARTDAILGSHDKRFGMMMELLRRQAKGDKEIHLAISVDSSRMYLEREGALLRTIPVEVGPERRIGIAPDTVRLAVPRGTRSVQAILGPKDVWEVPGWVYADRGLTPPEESRLAGALGPRAIMLDGGTVIYSIPTAGPLNDSSYVLPGSIRASAADLEAIAPNLQSGMAVYFY
ncbi:MAG TPA: hypothetical protein VFK39_02930 [Gemmatimonadaceae bacterium]|nr:hypothetical protein [Gemmatimonadaceae bacterium]